MENKENNISDIQEVIILLNKIKIFFKNNRKVFLISFSLLSVGFVLFLNREGRVKNFAYLIKSEYITPLEIRYKIDVLQSDNNKLEKQLKLGKDIKEFDIKTKVIDNKIVELWFTTSEEIDHNQVFKTIIDSVFLTDYYKEKVNEQLELIKEKISTLDENIKKLELLPETPQKISTSVDLETQREELQSLYIDGNFIEIINDVDDTIIIKEKTSLLVLVLASVFISFLLSTLLILILSLIELIKKELK